MLLLPCFLQVDAEQPVNATLLIVSSFVAPLGGN